MGPAAALPAMVQPAAACAAHTHTHSANCILATSSLYAFEVQHSSGQHTPLLSHPPPHTHMPKTSHGRGLLPAAACHCAAYPPTNQPEHREHPSVCAPLQFVQQCVHIRHQQPGLSTHQVIKGTGHAIGS